MVEVAIAGAVPAEPPAARRSVSLKAYVLALVAVFVIAAGVNVLYQRDAARRDARQAATADAGFAAGVAAEELAVTSASSGRA